MKKTIRNMKLEVDVIQYEDAYWTPSTVKTRPYYDQRFVCFVGVSNGVIDITTSRGFLQDTEHEIVGRIGSDGKMERIEK